MAGSNKLMTAGGGGVVLQPASNIASDVTMNIPSENGTLASQTYVNNSVSQFNGFKNRIINGAMNIAQRGTSSISAIGSYPVDRWLISASQASKFTAQQSSDAPAGFTNSVVLTSSSAYTVAGNDYFAFYQQIEGNNVADLSFGTASAKSVTVSFWTKSSLTGSFGGSIQNGAEDRCYSFAYTINTANTWEYKTVTAVGDTTGTWNKDTSGGMIVWFGLGATGSRVGTAGAWGSQSGAGLQPSGTVSLVGTSGATLYITGVQLEKGTTANSFDYRPYGTELQLCQRYCYVPPLGAICPAFAFSTTRFDAWLAFPVTMRAVPSGTYASGSIYYRVYLGGNTANLSAPLTNGINQSGVLFYSPSISGVVAGAGGWFESYNAPSGSIVFSAEL